MKLTNKELTLITMIDFNYELIKRVIICNGCEIEAATDVINDWNICLLLDLESGGCKDANDFLEQNIIHIKKDFANLKQFHLNN